MQFFDFIRIKLCFFVSILQGSDIFPVLLLSP